MKTKFSKLVMVAFMGAFVMVACKKENIKDQEKNEAEVSQVEGSRSETNNNDQALEIIESEYTQPLLTMHFDANVSDEEANKQWNTAVEEYLSRRTVEDRAFSTEWIFRVWTTTGTQSNNGTDGSVGTYVRFTTSAGARTSTFKWMNNPGNDREGGRDAYLFSESYPGQGVQWVEIDNATLYLEGTDGWFVTEFIIQMWNSDQTISATGFSNCWSYPNVWLDNNCTNSCWDSYYTGNIGSGRINF